jgi:hypothetical protein
LTGIAERVAAELAAHTAAHPEIHLTSAERGRGIAALRVSLAAFVPTFGPSVAASAMAIPEE